MTFGQTISRQVITCTGSLGNDASKITSTVGSNILHTTEEGETILTQGFQQPRKGSLFVSATSIEPDCYEISGGEIELTISGCTGAFEVLWNTGDSTNVIQNLLPGIYTYTVTSGSCSLTNSIELSLLADCSEEIPNLITPNSDGVNDFLEIPQFHLELNQINEVLIYNRWGQELWRGTNYDNVSVVWSGISAAGDMVPPGTYYYLVSTAEAKHSGFIELLR